MVVQESAAIVAVDYLVIEHSAIEKQTINRFVDNPVTEPSTDAPIAEDSAVLPLVETSVAESLVVE